MPADAYFDPEHVTWSDVVNWGALHAHAIFYRNRLALQEATSCSLPFLFTALLAVVVASYVLEQRRRTRTNINATTSAAESPPNKSGKESAAAPHPASRRGLAPVAAVLAFAAAGWVAETGLFGGFESPVERACSGLDDAVARERCLNETAEYTTLKTRNWNVLDAHRNYSMPRPTVADLQPMAAACIEPLTLRPFDVASLDSCLKYLATGGTLHDKGLINAKAMASGLNFDMPYMAAVMESLRRTRLRVSAC
jgi:hypothetical protein